MKILFTTFKNTNHKRYYAIVNLETLTVQTLDSDTVLLFENYMDARYYIDYVLFAKNDYAVVPAEDNYLCAYLVSFLNKDITAREDKIFGVIQHFNSTQGEDYIDIYEIIPVDDDTIKLEIFDSHMPITIDFKAKAVYYYNYNDPMTRLLDGEEMCRVGIFMNMLQDMLEEEEEED